MQKQAAPPPYCVKAIWEDAEIVRHTILRHCQILWIAVQCLLTKEKSYAIFWRNKLPLKVSHGADGTWQEMCNLWSQSVEASHHAQRLCRIHPVDGSTTILGTAQLTAQQSSYCILLVLTTAALTPTAPPPLGVLRCLKLQNPYSDPSNVRKSRSPQRADWRSKRNSFSIQVIQVWLTLQPAASE